jgi:hypothetical protein
MGIEGARENIPELPPLNAPSDKAIVLKKEDDEK